MSYYLTFVRMALVQKTQKNKDGVDFKRVKKWEPLHTVSGNAKQSSCYGKHYVVAQN